MTFEPQPPPVTTEAPPINLRHYLDVVLKRKYVVLATFVAVVVLTTTYNLKQTPIYEATTSVVIESLTPRVLQGVEDVVPLGTGTYWSNRDFYETEYKIIQSRALADIVIKKLALDKDLDFLGLSRLAERGDSDALAHALSLAQPAKLLMSKLTVTPVKESKMVLIQYHDHDPVRAAELANTHAQAYIDYNLDRRLDGTKTAGEWLNEQLGDLKDKLETSEIDLYNFKKEHNILAQTLEDRNELLKKNIEEISEELQATQNKRIALRARIDEIEKTKDDPIKRDALPEVVQNMDVQSLRRLQIDVLKELVQLRQRYGDKYPKLVEVTKQYDSLGSQINDEIAKIIGSIETEYRIALSTEHALEQALNKASLESLELNRKSVTYNKLRRENENDNRLYGVVMSRMKEADLTAMLKTNNVRIVDSAEPPRAPIYPKVQLNILASVLVGFVLGIALAFLLNYLDNTVKTQEDVERLGLILLGIVPNFAQQATAKKGESLSERERDLYVFENQRSQVAECSRAIRTNITFMSADRPIKRLLLVSAKPAEGKTTNAINLSTSLALSGFRTLLVDTDMRRPRQHRVFGFGSELGLSNYLLGERPIGEILRRTNIPNLDLLPCGPLPPSPAELLHTVKFRNMIEELDNRYDHIVFDSPPLVAVTDAAILSSLCDGVVFVIKAGQTPKNLVRQALAVLRASSSKILGVVINDIDLSSSEYGYYYSYYRQYGVYPNEATSAPKSG